MINCKAELRLRWKKHYILSVLGVDHVDNNKGAMADNFNFTIKDTKLYVPFVTLSAKDNQNLSKPLIKGLKQKAKTKL